MKNVFVSTHPFVQNALTHLRDEHTPTPLFRTYANQITKLLLTEATATFPTTKSTLKTPLSEASGTILSNPVALITILRAGLAMLPAAMRLFPKAPVGFVGLARDGKTATAHEYYWKIPALPEGTMIFLLDPMLATGGSLLHVLRKLGQTENVRLVTIISAGEGIDAIHKEFPTVDIFTGAIDRELNAQKFIVPGLGDFGDRFFGTT